MLLVCFLKEQLSTENIGKERCFFTSAGRVLVAAQMLFPDLGGELAAGGFKCLILNFNVNILYLDNPGITNTGVGYLLSFKTLNFLDLSGTGLKVKMSFCI